MINTPGQSSYSLADVSWSKTVQKKNKFFLGNSLRCLNLGITENSAKWGKTVQGGLLYSYLHFYPQKNEEPGEMLTIDFFYDT